MQILYRTMKIEIKWLVKHHINANVVVFILTKQRPLPPHDTIPSEDINVVDAVKIATVAVMTLARPVVPVRGIMVQSLIKRFK